MQELISRLLLKSGMSASTLARSAGIGSAYMSLMLSGDRVPTFFTVQRLLQSAGLPWAWLDENWKELKFESRPKAKPRGRPRKETK